MSNDVDSVAAWCRSDYQALVLGTDTKVVH